jgi:putative transposase
MARRLRIQFEGALYYVINRGNYRRDVFQTAGAAKAFEAALGETCERHQWRVHAYVIMCNHYHLALETPGANLVEGMHWLQSTYASRFNRFHGVHGHLFQGRYQALLIEDASALFRVANYIHLNPVRAKLVAPSEVMQFRWSSLPRCIRMPRVEWRAGNDVPSQLGLVDSREGWSEYARYLVALAGDPMEQERQEFSRLASGWAIGSAGWRKVLAQTYAHRALEQGIARDELLEIKESRWRHALQEALAEAMKKPEDIVRESKGAHWKIRIAQRLRRHVGAPHRWIATELNMGTPEAVRVNVARLH